MMRAPLRIGKARRCDDDEAGRGPGPTKPQRPEQQNRKQKIELFFDRQAPGVKQRLELALGIEISALCPEEEIRNEGAYRQQTLREVRQIARTEAPDGDREAGDAHEEERRQNAPGAPLVESDEAEAAVFIFIEDDRRDQIAADHEENVDPDKASRKSGDASVKEDHRQDRNGSQAVDLRSVRQLERHVAGVGSR